MPAASLRRACISARWPAAPSDLSSIGLRRFPRLTPGAYALVGMGTLFAGIIRAPMTSVFMIFEITQDYQILVPLMVANLLSFVISRHYQPTPVYHALLQQDGIHLPSASARATATTTAARHVMRTEVGLLPATTKVDEALTWAVSQGAHGCLIGTSEAFLGPVTRGQLEQWSADGQGSAMLESLLSQSFVHTHDDHPVDVVLERLWQSGGLLPVVSRADVHKLEGVITADSILRAGAPSGLSR